MESTRSASPLPPVMAASAKGDKKVGGTSLIGVQVANRVQPTPRR